jgi:hypothetical protein
MNREEGRKGDGKGVARKFWVGALAIPPVLPSSLSFFSDPMKRSRA